ncbi:MAG: hypothetical protein HY556_10415 [Euryarchaeota archaeon]|nr:hypothetical protein [Euryarchaeota archaeon]
MASASPVPVLKKIPQARRNLLFLPLIAAAYLVLLPIVGVLTQDLIIAFVVSLPPAVGIGYVLVGLPRFATDPRDLLRKNLPKITPDRRRALFIPGFLVLTAIAYVIAGILLTGGPVHPDYVAIGAIAVALVVAGVIATLLFGLPDTRAVKALLPNIPPERKPALFLPAGLLIALVLFFVLGIAITQVVTAGDYGALAAFFLSILIGFGVAYKVFGLPKTGRIPVERIPRVAPQLRSYASIATILILGPILAVVAGGLIAGLPQVAPDLQLYAGVLAGFLIAVVVAWRLFGPPALSAGVLEYVPRIPRGARPYLFFPFWFGISAGMTIAVETLLKIELYPVILGSLGVGFILAVVITGRVKRFARSPGDTVKGLSETRRAFLFLPAWLVLGTIFYFLAGYAVREASLTILAAYPLAFLLTLLVFEGNVIGGAMRTGRERKAHEKTMRDQVRARLREERQG